MLLDENVVRLGVTIVLFKKDYRQWHEVCVYIIV
jgi:hypothetical protein